MRKRSEDSAIARNPVLTASIGGVGIGNLLIECVDFAQELGYVGLTPKADEILGRIILGVVTVIGAIWARSKVTPWPLRKPVKPEGEA